MAFGTGKETTERRVAPGGRKPFAKYRKLVPSLALLNHLSDGVSGPVGADALLAAIALAEYLETHAERAYSSGSNAELAAGTTILKRVRRRDIEGEFTARDIHQRDWSSLTDRDQLQAGLNLLCDLNYLICREQRTGGRPRLVYSINPLALTQ